MGGDEEEDKLLECHIRFPQQTNRMIYTMHNCTNKTHHQKPQQITQMNFNKSTTTDTRIRLQILIQPHTTPEQQH